jgi:hypothetical protein
VTAVTQKKENKEIIQSAKKEKRKQNLFVEILVKMVFELGFT